MSPIIADFNESNQMSPIIADFFEINWPAWIFPSYWMKVLHDEVIKLYDYFVGVLYALIHTIAAPLQGAIDKVLFWKAELNAALTVIQPYLAFANAWVPIDVFFQLSSAYTFIWVVVNAYRFAKSMIPGFSGS